MFQASEETYLTNDHHLVPSMVITALVLSSTIFLHCTMKELCQ